MESHRTYSKEELDTIHKYDLELLLEIKRICVKHNIKFFLSYGTLLGAIRDKDFIPWDDDCDVLMLREDYERFLKIVKTEIGDGYFLLDHSTCSNYPNYFAKLCKKGTLLCEKEYANLKTKTGVFVDIFPYDYVPEDKEEYRMYIKHNVFWYGLIKSKYLWRVSNLSSKKKIGKLIRPILHILLMCIPYSFLKKKFYKNINKYNELKTNCVSMVNSGIQYPIEIFDEAVWIDFYNEKLPVPKGYIKYLELTYKNYLEKPPMEFRVSHHPEFLKL